MHFFWKVEVGRIPEKETADKSIQQYSVVKDLKARQLSFGYHVAGCMITPTDRYVGGGMATQ